MEQQEKFEAVLKKSVAMYSMLTGKPMSEREGRAFIEIFDMTDAYLANGTDTDTAASTFDILSHVELHGPTDAEQRQRIAELVNNPPKFVGREPEPTVIVHKTAEVPLSHELPRTEVYVDPASQEGDYTVRAEVATGENGEKTVTKITTRPETVDICGCPVGRCTCTDQMLEAKKSKERYTPPPITSGERAHIPGYDWQICVLSRQNDMEDSYIVHYAYMPTQKEFDEHYAKYQQRTHYVHVNEWVNYGWEGITRSYDTTSVARQLQEPDPVVRTAPAPELRGRDVSASPVTAPWEQEDKPWRIRYYSDTAGAVIFHYVDKRPTSAEMAHFHHAKCTAVSQAKPKQAA